MKHFTKKRLRVAASLLCSAMLLTGTPALPAIADTVVTLPGQTVTHTDRDYSWLAHTTESHTYDFESTDIKTYSGDPKLANVSLRTNMVFENGKLACREGKTFSFGTAVFLGDDYGLMGGEMSFDVAYTGGTLAVGIRLSKKAADNTKRGMWFTFTPDGLTVGDPESGFSILVSDALPTGENRLTVRDAVDTVTVTLGDKTLCTVGYDSFRGGMTVRDADGKTLGSIGGTAVSPAGYITLWADDFKGTVDNLTFEHTKVTDTTVLSDDHTVDYSTWVAVDDRDRTTPTGAETGAVREGKEVGVFYFLAWVGDDADEPKDVTALFLDKGLDGLKATLADRNNKGTWYWAEPYFGYYRNTDTWVYRKHAYMLEAAGVDFIFLDISNGATYSEAAVALFDTWLEMRREGQDTPQICYLGASSIEAGLNNLRGNIYSAEGFEKYGELFYEYEGKPLILGDYDKLSEKNRAFVDEKFTIRGCWAWMDKNGYWSWLQEYKIGENGNVSYVNGGPGRDLNGNFEALALCVGHHPTTSKGRSYVNTVFPTVNKDFGFSLDSGAGTGFQGQFEAIMKLDPSILLITGWNEWTAGLNWGNDTEFAGTRYKERFYMVDQFNTEYSRDAEPMRIREGEESVGFGDNYYYQMASMIRQFKGWNNVIAASGQGTVALGDTAAWSTVGPAYRDTIGDTELRSSQGYFNNSVYVNNTGRNDFSSAKVSQDADYLYFQVTCVHDIVMDDGANWMNLFLDVDGVNTNGWEGYDFVINRARDSHYVSIESLADGWAGKHVGQALYTVSGNTMTVRVSKAALGVSGELSTFLFKWADNSTLDGKVMEFMDLGDTAPNDRYSYMYVGQAGTTATVTYTLTANGASVALRDEATPLPGYESGSETETEGAGTDTQPVTDDETIPATQPDTTPDGTGSVVYRYSVTLKVMIVLTGAVLGGCAFALITVPRREKDD